jgi:tetratricopeptide (TPR) repeat protein
VAAAYHPEFLDGIETIVLSGEISRRFDADSLKYPGEAGLKASPRAHALQLYRGTALQNLGRSEEALEAVRAAYAGLGDPRILLNVGQILATMGRYEEAVAELARVPAGIPERAAARRDMAVILLNHLRRREEGIAALREAAALTQDPGEARLLMDEVARLERTIPPSNPGTR